MNRLRQLWLRLFPMSEAEKQSQQSFSEHQRIGLLKMHIRAMNELMELESRKWYLDMCVSVLQPGVRRAVAEAQRQRLVFQIIAASSRTKMLWNLYKGALKVTA